MGGSREEMKRCHLPQHSVCIVCVLRAVLPVWPISAAYCTRLPLLCLHTALRIRPCKAYWSLHSTALAQHFLCGSVTLLRHSRAIQLQNRQGMRATGKNQDAVHKCPRCASEMDAAERRQQHLTTALLHSVAK